MQERQTSKLTLSVKGMHCASCASVIESKIKKIEGVLSCEVSLGNEKAKLEFDSTKTNVEEFNKVISPLGYSLIEDHQHNTNFKVDHSKHLGRGQSKSDKLIELESMKKKLYFALPASIAVFVLMLYEILRAIPSIAIPMIPIDMMILNKILFILSSVTLFWIGGEFIKEVWVFIRYRTANMYTLVGIGTLVSYLYSSLLLLFPEVQTSLNLPESYYFDVTIVVIGFVYLGKYLESRSKLQTNEAVTKLIELQAKTALVERNGNEIEIPINELKVNDIVIVKPGAQIPTDGVIVEGSTSIDESMITGEPLPVDKAEKSLVIGGTINKQGHIKFKASKIGGDTLLSQIIKVVDEAQGSKAPIHGLADRISAVFVPTVLIISVVTLLVWLLIGPNFIPFDQALSLGILCFTGVLVIACPCALGLATPTAIIVATGKAAENGILIKNAESLEKLSKVKIVVTDKTGTITKGEPAVKSFKVLSNSKSESEVLTIMASLEKKSEHPISKAVLNYAMDRNSSITEVDQFESVEGKGIIGTINGKKYFVGNRKLIKSKGIMVDQQTEETINNSSGTTLIIADEKEILAVCEVADQIKDGVKKTISNLKGLGIKIVMLTGDNLNAAKEIADLAGIDEVIADVLPSEKHEAIEKLKKKGDLIAMVGDGINDAPALASADVGIAMSTGTDIAIDSAQIVLLQGDFSKVYESILISKFTIRAIKQNLFWAFSYNIIGIPLAAGLFYPIFGIVLNPIFAGLAMALSSVSVISNSLRLKFVKFK